MLELHVADGDVTGGSISIGWCVGIDTLKRLAEKGIKKPALVIITAPEGDSESDVNPYKARREYRKVVPLSDLVAYIEFRTAGKNNIWAFICEDVKQARGKFLEQSYSGSYNNSVLNYDGTEWSDQPRDFSSIKYFNLSEEDKLDRVSEPVSVFVPAECFAPEPAVWEKEWVNLFFNSKTEDQCAFRKRRLFAYTIQPLIMVFNLLYRFGCLLLATLIGARGWTANCVLHPLSTSINDADDAFQGGTYFIGRGENVILNWIRLPFMPVFVLLYLFLWHVHVLASAGFIALAIAGFAAIAFGITYLCFCYKVKREEAEAVAQAWYLNQEEMNLIVCSSGNKATSFNQLPPSKRTLRLRFFDLKSKVCRPFSA